LPVVPFGVRNTFFDALSPDLHLQPTIPAFEYPRRDLPAQVRFIGPLLPRAPVASASSLPAWWPDVEAAHLHGTPIVLLSQGTLATEAHQLIVPALRGLASEPVLVVATTRAELAAQGLPTLPANARVAPFIPHEALLPRVAVVISNGGYHGCQLALGHGVPLVVAAGSEDKPEVAARVAWSGLGLDLRTGNPTPRAVRQAVRRVLADERFARRARELAQQAADHHAPSRGAELIEALIASREHAREGGPCQPRAAGRRAAEHARRSG
jgi:UDP:flavonoid glycosyltransferase YjiC (YdhE family)